MGLNFELSSDMPCEREVVIADFLQVTLATTNRQFKSRQLQVPFDAWLRNYSRRSLIAKARRLIQTNELPADDVTVMAWSRLSDHNGLLRREGIAVHMVDDGIDRIPVKPAVNPRRDKFGMVQLQPIDEGYGPITAATYDMTEAGRQANHITEALVVRSNMGFVALRGSEALIPTAEWRQE